MSWIFNLGALLYFSGVFIRKKPSKSGVVSIQIIDKSHGSYEVVRTVGSSSDTAVIERLYRQAKQELRELTGHRDLNFDTDREKEMVELFFHHIEGLEPAGPEILLGKIFNEIGFGVITDELFRHSVISGLVYPVSKLKTVEYLFKYQGIIIDINKVYRYLDKFQAHQIRRVKQIGYEHTLSLLDHHLSVVFYNVPPYILKPQMKMICVKQDTAKTENISNRKLS